MHFPKSKLLKPAKLARAFEQKNLPIKESKAAIKHAHQQLAKYQNEGFSAAQLVEKYTWAVDRVITLAWTHCISTLDEEVAVALVAVGGYGRNELHPHSDVDLLVLLEKNEYEEIQPAIESFLQFLWDIGLEIGHSVRSIRDCLKEARQDVTIMTNLLEARSLAGDGGLLATLDDKLRNGRIWPADKFFAAKITEQEERHAKYQDTAYSLEPNIKESPGGLRDLQTILWVYNRQFGVRSFREMKDQGHLNNDEYRLLIRARNMLWKLRCGLHLGDGRREDRLLFDNQRALAQEYGYEDTTSHLAVEQLMKRYYRTAKLVIYLNEILLSHYRVNYSSRFSLSVAKNLNRNFLVKNKMIALRSDDLFERRPASILQMFLMMLEHNIESIHPDTIRAIRANLDRINNSFRNNPKCKELFLDLFSHRGSGLTNVLVRMNAYGVLGAYLPNFGAIVGQMQHDLFHVYTVDGHTLMVIRNLVRLREFPDEFPLASRILNSLYKPERLLIGALFHDIAKGRGGDHSVLGETDAYEFCIDHGMSEYDAKLVGWLVLNHLIMSHFSQRRDISDPEVINKFAEIVGDHEYLDNLYLLTLADIRGTSPKVWNAWKGQLLLELYQATSQALHRGIAKPINEEEHVADDKKAAFAKISEQIGKDFTDSDQHRLEEFWATLSNDYFIRNEPYYIAWHATSLLQTTAINLPLISARYSDRLEANMFFIFAPKSKDLLSKVTYSFDALELAIIEAQLQVTNNGFVLYSFNAIPKSQKAMRSAEQLRSIENRLRQMILTRPADKLISRRSVSRALKHFPIAPYVKFSQTNPNYTVMEVVAQDQPGLLHNVALLLQRHGVKPVSAKIATFGERAEDVFFIQNPNNTPITNQKLLKKLEDDIVSALDRNTTGRDSNNAASQGS
jgi:[protein-PII] uridylyltransferase